MARPYTIWLLGCSGRFHPKEIVGTWCHGENVASREHLFTVAVSWLFRYLAHTKKIVQNHAILSKYIPILLIFTATSSKQTASWQEKLKRPLFILLGNQGDHLQKVISKVQDLEFNDILYHYRKKKFRTSVSGHAINCLCIARPTQSSGINHFDCTSHILYLADDVRLPYAAAAHGECNAITIFSAGKWNLLSWLSFARRAGWVVGTVPKWRKSGLISFAMPSQSAGINAKISQLKASK